MQDLTDNGALGLQFDQQCWRWSNVPIVPLPPTLNCPNRANGAEQVVMFGETLRMIITLDGSEGTSFDVIVYSVVAGLYLYDLLCRYPI